MICEECKNNIATFHKITEINGDKSEVHLCAECAKEHRVFEQTNVFNVGEFLNTYMDGLTYKEPRFCFNCYLTGEDFSSTGFVGCEKCYTSFKDLLLPVIKNVQPNDTHVGKRYGIKVKKSKEEKIRELEKQLRTAINEQRFEDCSAIKAKIVKLREEGRDEQ